ncbi:MAG: GIY-YIG nuclease family protein [Clostridia bacterium]|jgi:putative endonuclease|nr:GIY-YIG nuclease family protein [Clostridia bacterium]
MFVYILRCKGDTLYTGFTPDLARRYREHCQKKGAKYTRSHPPCGIAAAWEVEGKSDALRLEYRIKTLSRAEKDRLIESGTEGELFGIRAERIHPVFESESTIVG